MADSGRIRRFVISGALTFCLAGVLSGAIWATSTFPFAVGLEWAIGMGVLAWMARGAGVGARAALVGALAYTVAFGAFSFFAITNGSALPVRFLLAIGVSAGLAGALVGSVVGRMRGAVIVGVAAAVGYIVGSELLVLLQYVTPEAALEPGGMQIVFFSAGIGLRALVAGGFIGAAFAGMAPHAEPAAGYAIR